MRRRPAGPRQMPIRNHPSPRRPRRWVLNPYHYYRDVVSPSPLQYPTLARVANKTAVVVGSGPNGLSAAILLQRAGYQVTVHEANEQIGGGARSAELTLPGFVHDICSAVHPMVIASPC